MPDQDDVFSTKTNPPATPEATSSQPTGYEDLLSKIVNEHGEQKYASVDKAIEGLAHSQSYIPQLKSELSQRDQELARLREELAKREAVEDVVSRLASPRDQDTTSQVANQQAEAMAGLDEQGAKKLFETLLQEQRQTETVESNRREVNKALSQKYGDKAAEVVAEKAKELGTTVEEIGKLSSTNPKLVLTLFGSSSPQGAGPTTSSNNLPNAPAVPALERPTKSLLAGASGRDQAEFMRKIRERVYARHGITN